MSKGGNEIKEDPWTREFAKVADEKWALYKNEYEPLAKEYMNEIDAINTEGRRDFVEGAAMSGTSKAFGEAANSLERNITSTGTNPNSGKYKTRMGSLRDLQGASGAETATRADMQLQDDFVTGLSNISALGRGESTKSQVGLSDISQLSARKAEEDAVDAWNNKSENAQAIGFGLGAAGTLYGNSLAKGKTTNDVFNSSKDTDYSLSTANTFNW